MSPEEINRLLELSKIGDDLKNFKESGGYAVLKEHVLDPLERGTFEAFVEIPADDINAIIMTQAMAKIIKKIYQEIDIKINEGMLSKNQLNNSEGE